MKGMAFCPAHITGFFKAEISKDAKSPETLGSLGAGFSIKDGVTTAVELFPSEMQESEIIVSGYQSENTHVSQFVIDEFSKFFGSRKYFVKVHHELSIPVGYGLGCSGAVALSLSFALNKALSLNLSNEQVGQIAHRAEVLCKTGLGDVLASYHGGFEIRTKPGAPGIGSVQKINSNDDVIVICFSPISTKKFMTEKIDSINGLGGKMVKELVKTKDTNLFQDMSIEFAKYVQVMTPRMELIINELHQNNIKCGVALFGETIFAIISPKQKEKVLSILNRYDDAIIIKSKIDNFGARLQ